MDRTILEIFLPAFIIVFFAIISLWAYFRGRHKVKLLISKTSVYRRVQFIDTTFKIILVSLGVIVFVYTYFPEQYSIFVPIEFLDHPIINFIGVLTLKISLIWIVIAQLTIDKSAYMIRAGIAEWDNNKLMLYSEKLLLSGMLIMFIGFFITISSGVAILMCLIAIVLFEKLLRIQ